MALIIVLVNLVAFGHGAITVPDSNGRSRTPLVVPSGKKAVVLIFITDECPEVNACAPEINRICDRYQKRGVEFYLVETDSSETPSAAREHARAYGFTCGILMDRQHALVKKCGATQTTECAVFTPDGVMRYRGRLDDRYFALGRPRPKITHHDLADALDAVLTGRPVAERFTRVYGCVIPPL